MPPGAGHARTETRDARGRLARMIEAIVARCPELQRPSYLPPWFLASTWLNVAAFIIKAKLGVLSFVADGASADAETGELLAREYMEGDEDLSIDWLRDANTRALPDTAPLCVILPTVAGTGPSHAYYMQAAAARGWRTCCLNKRGLSEALRPDGLKNGAGGFLNLIGDQDDVDAQMAWVMQRFPEARFVGMVGLSAGSGLLVNYLGTRGVRSPVQAGCSLCPAYDIETAFKGMKQEYPAVDAFIRKDLQTKYIARNQQAILDRCSLQDRAAMRATLDRCLAPSLSTSCSRCTTRWRDLPAWKSTWRSATQ